GGDRAGRAGFRLVLRRFGESLGTLQRRDARFGAAAKLFQDLTRAFGAKVAERRDLFGDALEHLPLRAGRAGHHAGMQAHVSTLAPLGGERAQRGEVGGEPRGGGDSGEILSGFGAEELERQARAGVRTERAADGADGHGEVERADEVLPVAAPYGERLVA